MAEGKETSEYRIVYNWGKSTYDICDVWSIDGDKPHAYHEVCDVSTHDDDWSIDDEPTPVGRLRNQLTAMLVACDKPVLRFPEDFDA